MVVISALKAYLAGQRDALACDTHGCLGGTLGLRFPEWRAGASVPPATAGVRSRSPKGAQ